MNGHGKYRWQKWSLGAIYLLGCFGLSVYVAAICRANPEQIGPALLAVGGVATGTAVGLATIVWGNVQQHKAAAAAANGAPATS